MSDTPRTDFLEEDCSRESMGDVTEIMHVLAGLARTLERELAAMTARAELAERERDYAIERAKSAHLERDSTARQGERDMVRANLREFEIIDARKAKELAERQVARLSKALENAAARLHTANTVGAFDSGDDLAGYLAEGYRQAHEAIIEAAKGVQG